MSDVVIRWAQPRDLASVAAIYGHYATDTLITFEENPPSLAAWQTRLDACAESGWPFVVAVDADGDRVLGFALLQPFRGKSGWRFAAENTIYLDAAATGRGVGRRLLDELAVRGEAAGVRSIIAVISDVGTEASRALHAKAGYVESGHLAGVGFKHGHRLGVYLMTLHLPPYDAAVVPDA